ncbi:hypothetical protein [Streptomyces sp. AK08-02]|uniref:hypothetical protein n=1 Tax=Streptomyces sp. AK08-02 TaxID=3028654 RepID=UPI0029A08221|nr:hypothetical protein [Streptomyces sp. AK08-02]MDX3753712.1 hypothetical protein [Streptomyces sp. AK08-02]
MQHTARRGTADDLQIVLDHWTSMRDLIDTSTPGTWPPAMGKGEYLRTLDDHDRDEMVLALKHAQHLVTHTDEHGRPQYECLHCDYVGEGRAHIPRADRDGLGLGERPVPLRLYVVDACRAVEVALCSLADEIAAEVQVAPLAPMPAVKHSGYATLREAQVAAADRGRRDRLAAEDAASPYRWSFTMGDRSAVRAAEWLLARIEGHTGACKPISSLHRARIALVAREAARRIERTIGGVGERYSVVMDGRPCPYCGGDLTMHSGGGLDDVVTCAGPECSAPVGLDGGRRTWSRPEQLAALQVALDAAERRRKRAEARARQRAAARARQAVA